MTAEPVPERGEPIGKEISSPQPSLQEKLEALIPPQYRPGGMPIAEVLEELWQESDPKMLARRKEALKILREQERASAETLARRTELANQAKTAHAQDAIKIEELRQQLAEIAVKNNAVERKDPAKMVEQIFNFILKLAADSNQDDGQIIEAIIAQMKQLYDSHNPLYPDVFDKLDKITQEIGSDYNTLPDEETKTQVKRRINAALKKLIE